MPPRFPVFWFTVIVYTIVGAATQDLIFGAFFLCVVLPIVSIVQWCIRWVALRFHRSIRLRRMAMLVPAMLFAAIVFWYTNSFGRQSQAISVSLAGQIPTNIRELQVRENSWAGYGVCAFFRCDSESLRRILNQPPFNRSNLKLDTFSFSQSPFANLRSLPELQDIIVFERSDLKEARGSCRVYTDVSYSFAYIEYAVD